MNRLNSEQFDIAATLTVEELRDHRKIRREKRDQEIERMERILVNQGQKINVYEKQMIEKSLTLLKTEKMEDLNNFMKLLIEAKYNIKIDAFNQKDCVICFDTFDQDELIIRIPKCGHIFHKSCCFQWFESKG